MACESQFALTIVRRLFALLSLLIVPLARGGGLSLLHVSPHHHYFTNAGGEAVFLRGKHNWPMLVNNNYYGLREGPSSYDAYTNYIADLVANNQNLTLLWTSDVIKDQSLRPAIISDEHDPLPFTRTGPCCALDGGNKFDLKSYNPAYFNHLSNVVSYANENNVYCIVRLFDGWRLANGTTYGYWENSIYNAANNTSGVLVDMTNLFRLDAGGSAITNILADYVRHTIDTLAHASNVLWEISLETPPYSTNFQRFIIEVIRSYEGSSNRLVHPVGLSAFYPSATPERLTPGELDECLWQTNGIPRRQIPDYISPAGFGPTGGADRVYTNNPPPLSGGVYPLVILDTDHLDWNQYGSDTQENTANGVMFTWKAFTRGYSVLYMDGNLNEVWPLPLNSEMQRSMGDAARYAARMNLITTGASINVATTGFCLTNETDFLVYSPDRSKFQVALPSGSYACEWFDPGAHAVVSTMTITAKGGRQVFRPPIQLSSAVLYIKRFAENYREVWPGLPPQSINKK